MSFLKNLKLKSI